MGNTKPTYFAIFMAFSMFVAEILGPPYDEYCNIYVFCIAVVMYTLLWMFRNWRAQRKYGAWKAEKAAESAMEAKDK